MINANPIAKHNELSSRGQPDAFYLADSGQLYMSKQNLTLISKYNKYIKKRPKN